MLARFPYIIFGLVAFFVCWLIGSIAKRIIHTAGKRTQPMDRPVDGTEVIDVDRGGKITWHGPGQLVGYPIVRLVEPFGDETGERTIYRWKPVAA